jgi:hypothetical protein
MTHFDAGITSGTGLSDRAIRARRGASDEDTVRVRTICAGKIPHEFGSLESLAAAALEHTVANERRALLAFLNELLDGGHPDADLEHAWNVQSPTYNFSAGGHRVFFEIVRRMILEDRDGVLAARSQGER